MRTSWFSSEATGILENDGAHMRLRIRGLGRADRMARSVPRAVWPSFEGQDILRWHIMHEGHVASVVCKGLLSALDDVELDLGLGAGHVFQGPGGMERPASRPADLGHACHGPEHQPESRGRK